MALVRLFSTVDTSYIPVPYRIYDSDADQYGNHPPNETYRKLVRVHYYYWHDDSNQADDYPFVETTYSVGDGDVEGPGTQHDEPTARFEFSFPTNSLVGTFRVPTDPGAPGYDASRVGQLLRIFHNGSGGIIKEAINELKATIQDIEPVLNKKGSVTIRVEPIASNVAVGDDHFGNPITIKGNQTSVSPDVDFTTADGGYTYRQTFEVTAAGQYEFTIQVSNDQPPLKLKATVPAATVTPAPTGYTLALQPAAEPLPTSQGKATGSIAVHVTGGPGPVKVMLFDSGDPNQRTFLTTQNLAANGSDTVTFGGLPSGFYDVKASLLINTNGDKLTKEQLNINVLPPDLEIGDQLVFLPWVQPTLTSVASGTHVQLKATLSTDPAVAASGSAPAIPATPDTHTEDVATTQARIYGPGEVLGLQQRAILGTTPAPDATGFSPLQLAAIAFQDEDLPWRYSTRKRGEFTSDFNGKDLEHKPEAPLPWLFLLVLKNDGREFTTLPLAGALPRIAVGPTAPLPSVAAPTGWVAQPELWAHVQVMAPLGIPGDDTTTPKPTPPTPPTATELDEFLNKKLPASPDLAYSRLLSPRRLAPDTAYTAFVLPALEVGRLAGLGLSTTNIDEQTPAIPDGARGAALEFPVYFQWQFSTGSEEDFESLVAQLGSAQASTTAATAPSLAVPLPGGPVTLPMPALLVDAAAPAVAQPTLLPAATYLYEQVQPGLTRQHAAGSRPVVAPPAYGRAYFDQPTLAAPTTAALLAESWPHPVNLDPRYRALAALGAQVVRTNQEEYVRRAWDQVQDILLANEKLRGAQYGLRTTAGLRTQHLPLATITTTTTTTGAAGGGQRIATSGGATSFARAQAVAEDGASASFVPKAEEPEEIVTTSVGMADYGLHLTGLALSRVRLPGATAQAPTLTAREAIRRSSTPLAAFSPTFRRITKPFGNYVVGQAGRPLRPTQPEGPAPAHPTLRETGTSLRQRDVLLTSLAQGRLAATPPLPEQARTLQFNDNRVDKLLLDFDNKKDASKIAISQLANNPEALGRLQAAFGGFVVQPTATTSTSERRVGFRKPQYKRPPLALPELLTGVVTGTAPGPIFTKKIEHVAPAVVLPPTTPVPGGDFEAVGFNADHFYVGDDVSEPSHTIVADWQPGDFSATDFRALAQVVYDYDEVPTPDGPIVTDSTPVLNIAATSEFSEGNATSQRSLAKGEAEASLTGANATPAATAPTVSQSSTAASAAPPATDGMLPAIKQAKVFPVFKDPMGEPLRLLHPDLFVPGLADFPQGGVAMLDVNQAFIEAYMVGLNHALGSELSWRGFPVDLRGTFFQQFWDVSEHLNTTLAADATATASQEAAVVDITPLDQWGQRPLGTNAPAPAAGAPVLLRLAVRSELLRRYPNLVLALQLTSVAAPAPPALPNPTAPDTLLHPRQRLAVGQDVAIVTFAIPGGLTLAAAQAAYSLLLMERPGQPKFGFDELAPDSDLATPPPTTTNPLSWNDLAVPYLRDALGIDVDENLAFYPSAPAAGVTSLQPRATAEPAGVAYLTDGARVAYALFQEPILACLPLAGILD